MPGTKNDAGHPGEMRSCRDRNLSYGAAFLHMGQEILRGHHDFHIRFKCVWDKVAKVISCCFVLNSPHLQLNRKIVTDVTCECDERQINR